MLTMTPQARALAIFTVAVALLVGQLGRISLGIVLLLGDAMPSGRGGQLVVTLLQLVVAGAVFLVALALAKSTGPGWPADLTQAAVLVAALAFAITAVVGIGAVAQGNGSIPASGFPGLF